MPALSATSASRTASHACSDAVGSCASRRAERSSQPRATAARPPKRSESQASADATRAAPTRLPAARYSRYARSRAPERRVGVVEPPLCDADPLERLGIVLVIVEIAERLVPPSARQRLPAGRKIGHSRSIARAAATATRDGRRRRGAGARARPGPVDQSPSAPPRPRSSLTRNASMAPPP